MTPREEAIEIVESVCKALGTDLRNYMPRTKEQAIQTAEDWIREREHA